MSERQSPSGNILTTKRNGIVGWDVQEQPVISSIDNMTYTYTGAAQLQSITDSRPGLQGFASGTTAYTYDGRGNVTGASGRRAYGITYNPLDLPYRIEGKTRDEIWYTHSREKLRVCQKEGQNDVCRLYLGNLELEWDPITEIYKPKAWHHPEGKMMLHAEPQSNIKDRIRLHYYLRDHLGNTVVAFDDRNYDACPPVWRGAISDVEEGTQSEVIGRYHYYAFGMQWNNAWVGSDIGGYWQQRYRYNGKELHSNSGLLDYGFRYYDPSVGRFTGVDPLAEKMPAWSPYSYTFNNPIRFIDPDGRKPQDIIVGGVKWTPGASGSGHSSFVQNTFAALNQIHKSGNSQTRNMIESFAKDNNFEIAVLPGSRTTGHVSTVRMGQSEILSKYQTIYFSTNEGVLNSRTGESFSPDVAILHEFGHIENARIDLECFLERRDIKDSNWKNLEEAHNIETWEHPYSEGRGMLQRDSYSKDLKTFKTINSTSNEKLD